MSPARRRNARAGLIIAVIVAVLLGGATRVFADPCVPGEDLEVSLRDVRTAARRHAGLAEATTWRRRARASALLPAVTLRAARALDWDDDGINTGQPTEVGNNVLFEARLSWRLDRLLYDPAEPRLRDVERDNARARSSLDSEVTRLYFEWRRAQLAAETGDPIKLIDAEEAWAHLDARTGGWLEERRCLR